MLVYERVHAPYGPDIADNESIWIPIHSANRKLAMYTEFSH